MVKKVQPDVGVLDVDGGPEPPGVPGDVVGEDDGPHARLARAGLAHQQNFFAVHVGYAKIICNAIMTCEEVHDITTRHARRTKSQQNVPSQLKASVLLSFFFTSLSNLTT